MFFGGFSGATFFQPDSVADNSYTPPVVLTEFRLSGSPVDIGGSSPLSKSITYATGLTLSHDQRIFSLAFSALSYFSPATNRYRYKLEGLDKTWHGVGSNERLATYTTLPAGDYTFRVQGATSRGAWTEPGAVLRIEILPAWWRTWWFVTICAVAAFLVAFSAYSYRMHQIALQFELRLEARVSERTRIARVLHDTLLQSFQALLLSLQSVRKVLPDSPEEAARRLDSAIDQTAQAIVEGRDAVSELRSSTVVANDLANAIGTLGEDLSAQGTNHTPVVFDIDVEGTPRNLHPILRDEVYRIAAEAMRNAFRHAEAQKIEVDILYDDRQFGLRIRDDGKGIDPRLLTEDGLSGHFGLHGMRERAKLIGGRLELWSKLDSGTEIELNIPAAIAYRPASGPRSGKRETEAETTL
jgi:signal transduction histidine kinase